LPDPTGRVSHLPDNHRGIAWKEPCRAASTANVAVTTGLANGQVVDGVTLATGDRVLLKNQTAGAENGIWVSQATGTAIRAFDMDQDATSAVPASEVLGAVIKVIAGTANGGTLWQNTNTSVPVIGTTALTFSQIVTSGSSGGSLPWFNVMNAAYGALNDGTTDDTAAINLAIAALVAAGRGVLYFPAGTGYKVTATLTALSVPCLVLGDGGSLTVTPTDAPSRIIFNSTTTAVFSVTSNNVSFAKIAGHYTGSTPSAGNAFIQIPAGGSRGYWATYDEVTATGFYVNYDFAEGGWWHMRDCASRQSWLYGLRTKNTASPDEGDWSMVGCYFVDGANSSTAAIRIESAGGGKIINTKINSSVTVGFLNGIDVSIGAGIGTGVLLIANNSIENVRGDAITIATISTGFYGLISITGNEVGLYSNNTGRAVKISAATNGAFPANGSIGVITIAGGTFHTSGTARAAVELIKTDLAWLGDYQISGFNARYTSSGDTNTTDAAPLTIKDEGVALATAATSIDFVGTAVSASGTTAAKTVTVSLSAGGAVGEILISNTPSTPLVFADLIQNEAQTDLVYADIG